MPEFDPINEENALNWRLYDADGNVLGYSRETCATFGDVGIIENVPETMDDSNFPIHLPREQSFTVECHSFQLSKFFFLSMMVGENRYKLRKAIRKREKLRRWYRKNRVEIEPYELDKLAASITNLRICIRWNFHIC